MKKLFIFMGALALMAGAFGVSEKRAVKAGADLSDAQVSNLKAMMEKYIDADGQYTKKTRIYLKEDTPDIGKYFHAGHSVQERTTYYDDDVLLMGDLDGSFDHINSGYANSGSNMVHFRSEDGVNAINLPDRRTPDYTVVGKQMSNYFFDLHDLVNSIQSGDWGLSGSLYYHDITNLGLDENEEFKDPLLKKFQYFAAPMLLQTANHYFSYKSITINEEYGHLHICIYLSDGDSGKVDSGSNLLAEARVYAGLVKPGYYLVGNYNSDKYDWQIRSSRPLTVPTEGTDHAQMLSVMLPAKKYQIAKLNADGSSTWYNAVPQISTYPYAEMDGSDIHIKYGGTYSIYLNSSDEIYIFRVDHKSATFNFNLSTSSLSSWSPVAENFGLHMTTTESLITGVEAWGSAAEKLTLVNGVYTLTVNFNGTVNGIWFYFTQSSNEKKTQDGAVTFPDIDDGGTYTITVGSLTWASDGIISGGVSIA